MDVLSLLSAGQTFTFNQSIDLNVEAAYGLTLTDDAVMRML